MAFVTHTVTGDLRQMFGDAIDITQVAGTVETNLTPGMVMVFDLDNDIQRLGSGKLTINTDGTWTLDGVPSWDNLEADQNPTHVQIQVRFEYNDKVTKQRVRWLSGFLQIDHDGSIGEFVAQQLAPADWRSDFMAEAQEKLDAQIDISNIAVSDDVVEALVKNTGGTGPKTSSALSATYGDQQAVFANGVYPARATSALMTWVGPARRVIDGVNTKNGDTWIQKKDGILTEVASLAGLVGYWPCNEGSGTTVHDRSANPVDGTLSGTHAVLGTWNQPAGVGALGLLPTGTGRVDIPAAAKHNVGDNFTLGVQFRRCSQVAGTVFQRGTSMYGTLGAELFGNADFSAAFSTTSAVGNFKATVTSAGLVRDSTVTYSGAPYSARLDIDAANSNNGLFQTKQSRPAGRKRTRFRVKDDPANANGKHSAQLSLAPTAGGSTLYLTSAGAWSTSSQDFLTAAHDHSGFILTDLIYDTPAAGDLTLTIKRQAGAGGGVAYSIWTSRDGSNPWLAEQDPVTGAWAAVTDAAGVFSLKAPVAGSGYVTIASAPASTDHLTHHELFIIKNGATTKVEIDGVDATVAGTNVTIGSATIAAILGNGDFGQFSAVVENYFLVNRALTAPEIAAIHAEGNWLPDKDAANLKTAVNNYTLGTNMDGNRLAYAAVVRSLRCTVAREAFAWSTVQPTNSSTFDWTKMDELVNNLVAQGLEIRPFFDLYPTWASSAGDRVFPTDVTLTKGLSVASAGTSFATFVVNYVAFMVACVNRYGRPGMNVIHSWEIGNEMNGDVYSSPAASAALYAYLFNAARTGILAADPTAKVGAASVARLLSENGSTNANSYLAIEWIRAIIAAGIADFDFIGGHPYPSNNGSILTHTVNSTSGDQMHSIRDTLMEYGRTPKVVMNEVGWYTGNVIVRDTSGGVSLPISGGVLNLSSTTTNTAATTADMARLPTSGTVYTINSAGAIQAITYTGKSGTTLTGCTGGTGTLVTGNPVSVGAFPLTEGQQSLRIAEAIACARDYFSAFGDLVGIYSINTLAGSTADKFDGCALYKDFAATSPKIGASGYTDASLAFFLQQHPAVAPTPPVAALPARYEAIGGQWVRVSS